MSLSISPLSWSTSGYDTVFVGSILSRIQQEQEQQRRQRQEVIGDVDVGDNTYDGPPVQVETIERAIRKMKEAKFDLNKDIDDSQPLDIWCGTPVTPMVFFCDKGDVRMVVFLLLLGASGTRTCDDGWWFPMFAAAFRGHLKVVQLLYRYGGDAKYDINKENPNGETPLGMSILDGHLETTRWVLLQGGGQQLSVNAVEGLRFICRHYEAGRDFMNWVEEYISFHDTTFVLFLCGATQHIATTTTLNNTLPAPTASPSTNTMTTTTSLMMMPCTTVQSATAISPSVPPLTITTMVAPTLPYNDITITTNQHITKTGNSQCLTVVEVESIHQSVSNIQSESASAAVPVWERPLQRLNGQPGVMELISDYCGLIRGKELRMLKEFQDFSAAVPVWECPLQLLNGQPGVMELISDYCRLI